MKKFFIGFAAVVLAIGAVAFTTAKVDTQTQYWYFASSSSSDIDDAGEYVKLSSGFPTCDGITTLPCRFVEVTASIDETSELQTYLNDFPNDAAIVSSSLTKKSGL